MFSFYRYLYQNIHILHTHKRKVQPFTQNNKGAAALEFAIVFPVFIMACLGIIYVFMLFFPQLTARYINFEAARYIGSGSSNITSLNYACTDHGAGAGVGNIASDIPHPLLSGLSITPNSVGTISNESGGGVRLSGEQLSAQAYVNNPSLSGVFCTLLHACNAQLGNFDNKTYSAVVATPNPFVPCK